MKGTFRFHGRVRLGAALTVVILGLLAPPAFAPPRPLPSAVDIARELGYSQKDMKKIYAGEVVALEVEEKTRKELAVTLAMLLRAPVPELFEHIQKGAILDVDQKVLDHGTIPEGPVTAASFSGLSLDPKEVKKLSKIEAGSSFNLAEDEIRLIQKAAVGGPTAVEKAYLEILAARAEAYRGKGIQGIPPYQRKKGELATPAEELRTAAQAAPDEFKKALPSIYKAFLNYPKDAQPEITNKMNWAVYDIQDRPTVVLLHRMMGRVGGGAFLLVRQFYVGQSYNSLQIMVGIMPVAEATLCFYINRTSTDQVAGFGSKAAHRIGRGVMKKEVISLFESARQQLERP